MLLKLTSIIALSMCSQSWVVSKVIADRKAHQILSNFSFCHENKFLVCVNILGNKAHSDICNPHVLYSVFLGGVACFYLQFFQLLHTFSKMCLFFQNFTHKSKNCTHKMQKASHLLQNVALHSKYPKHISKANTFAIIIIPVRFLCVT